jgi:hypothetical protein
MSIDLESAGAASTAASAARELDSAQSQKAGAHALICANCGAALAGAYCHQCGQSAHVHRSLGHMLEESMHGVLHFDTKSWRTLPLLIARPGVLTRRYIDGQRVRYVSPLALFLFTVFLMFFLISQITEPLANVTLSSAPVRQLTQAEIQVGQAPAAIETAPRVGAADQQAASNEQSADGQGKSRLNINFKLPRWAENNSGNARLDQALRNPDLTLYKTKNTAYKFSFMLIPISLPFLWAMFCRRRDVTLYDHMVFSLYSLSFMSLWAVLVAVLRAYEGTRLWSWGLFLIPPVHMYLQLRETYALGWFATLWRTGALLAMAGTVFLVFLGLVLSMSVR